MKRIAVVLGTRPEGIKLAPVVRALRETPGVEPLVVSTGQHKELLAPILAAFDVRPDVELDVMTGGQTLPSLTAKLVEGLHGALAGVDATLVQGDTTTAFVGALASFYHKLPVGHVEAGLRTGNPLNPFPEEGNRRLVGVLANWHFAPTERSRANLLREGVDDARVLVTGNTVVDALELELARQETPGVGDRLRADLAAHLGDSWWSRPYVLMTGHRRESFGGGFEDICGAVQDLASARPDLRFVWPVHLNPNVDGPVRAALSGVSNVHLIPPQGYSPFLTLLQHCTLALTDSGGVQEEAPSLGKPVLVMRETTERPEGVDAGVVRLVGTSRAKIVAAVNELLDDRSVFERMARAQSPYGDGRAAERIARFVAQHA